MKNFFSGDEWISRLTKDSLTYFAGKIIPSLVGFLTVILLSRVFGASVYGRFSVAISIILTLETILSGWLSQGILRFYSECGVEGRKGFYENTWRIYLGILPLGYVALCLILSLVTRDTVQTIIVSLFLFTLTTAFSLQTTFLQARLKARSYAAWESAKALSIPLFAILIFWIFRAKNDLTILLGYAVSNLLVVLLMLLWQEKFKFSLGSSFDRDLFKVLLRFGAPLALWLGSSYLLNISDRYIIAGYCSYRDTGIYSAAYDIISKGLGILFMPIVTAAHPLIMDRWNKKDYASALSVLKRGILYEVLGFIPIAIILFIFRHQFVLLALGPEFKGAERIILPVAGGSFLWRLSMLLHKPLELRKKTMLMAGLVSLALLVNVLSNLYFVPKYGYIAAAYSTIGSFFVYFAGIVGYVFWSRNSNDQPKIHS